MRWRDVLEKTMAVVGVVVVLVPVVTLADAAWQIATVVVGLVLIEAGVWNVARHLAPEDRKFGALRRQVEAFLEDVRELNLHAIAGDRDGIEEARDQLHERVDAMAEVAGDETA